MENQLIQIAQVIENESGINYNESNIYQLQSRIESFLKDENIDSLETLIKKINSNDSVLKSKLVDKATNNETLFFRDENFFKGLEDVLIKYFDKTNEVKIWSAASSTGQEALSVMMLLESLKTKYKFPNYKIVATDICQRALAKASSGVYSDFEVNRGLNKEQISRYFEKYESNWLVKPEFLKKIAYSYNNLLKPQVIESFDIILCRNILIYQTQENKKKIIEKLTSNLNKGGLIVLGGGETLMGVNDVLTRELYANTMFYRK